MASREAEGREVLALFKAVHDAAQKLHDKMVEMDKGASAKNLPNKERVTLALLGELKQFSAAIHCFHHSIGHLFFSRCWEDTEVGDEFVHPVDALMKKLGFELHSAGEIDLSKPLPDGLPDEVREALLKLKMSQEMSRKSHLH